jgi:hypothetical protein
MSKTPKLVTVKVRIKPLLKQQLYNLAKRLDLSMNKVIVAGIVPSILEHRQDAAKRRTAKEKAKP